MNIKTLSDRLGLDEEDFLVLLDLLISTAQTDLEKLRESVKNNEMDVTVNLAHSLKGSAGNLGFMDFSQAKPNSKFSGYLIVIQDFSSSWC